MEIGKTIRIPPIWHALYTFGTNIHPRSCVSDCPVHLVNIIWYPLTQFHLSWMSCRMNNRLSCDLYPFKGERGSFARYPSTYKCIWHNCWDTAALTWPSLICLPLNHCVYIALSCFSSLLKCAQQHWCWYLQCTALLLDCTAFGALMRWSEGHGGQGPGLPLTPSMTSLSSEVLCDSWAAASPQALPQHVLIPALSRDWLNVGLWQCRRRQMPRGWAKLDWGGD